MKRIEKYSLEELRDKYLKYMETDAYMKSNIDEFVEYCNEEIKTMPRIATINTVKEYAKAVQEKQQFCDQIESCGSCKYHDSDKLCSIMFFSEEVEVEE